MSAAGSASTGLTHAGVFTFDAARGGDYETGFLRNHRAERVADIQLDAAASRQAKLEHKHPISMGLQAAGHSQQMVPGPPGAGSDRRDRTS